MAKDKKQAPKADQEKDAPALQAAPAAEAVSQSAQQQPQLQPGIQIVAQYIKDLSFENPNAPESLVTGWPPPDTNVQIFLRHQNVREDLYECTINFRIEAKKKGEEKICFIVDLSYGALVVLKGIPAENHAPLVMVEVPKLLFPFAREIVANATSAGGYPPLYLTPISFEQIYLSEMKRQQEIKVKQAEQDQKARQAGN